LRSLLKFGYVLSLPLMLRAWNMEQHLTLLNLRILIYSTECIIADSRSTMDVFISWFECSCLLCVLVCQVHAKWLGFCDTSHKIGFQMLGKQGSKIYVFMPTLDSVLRKYFHEITGAVISVQNYILYAIIFLSVSVSSITKLIPVFQCHCDWHEQNLSSLIPLSSHW
jgi:hypothetical protein